MTSVQPSEFGRCFLPYPGPQRKYHVDTKQQPASSSGRPARGHHDGAWIDSRHRRLCEHRHRRGHCRAGRDPGRDDRRGGGDLQRAEQRAVGGQPPGQRRHLRVRLPLPEAMAGLQRRLDVSAGQVGVGGDGRAGLCRLSAQCHRRAGQPGCADRRGADGRDRRHRHRGPGISRSNQANIVIVSITLAALVFFVLAGLPTNRPGQLRALLRRRGGHGRAPAIGCSTPPR